MPEFTASVHGRLGRDPKPITTSTGKAMTVCPLAVNVPVSRSDDTETVWLDVLAFGRLAEDLARHKQGDLVNVMGNITINRWTKDGETRTSWQLLAEALVSARTTRPGGGRKRDNEQHRPEQRQQQAAEQFQQPEFVDDELPPF